MAPEFFIKNFDDLYDWCVKKLLFGIFFLCYNKFINRCSVDGV